MARQRQLVGILWRVALAAALCTLAFWLGTGPGVPRAVGMRRAAVLLWRVLDAPVSALNFLLPVWAKTSAAFSAGFQCFPTIRPFELMRYIAIGLPGYLVLLYSPAIAQALSQHITRRRSVRGA